MDEMQEKYDWNPRRVKTGVKERPQKNVAQGC